jgi:hypothetical protein
MSKLLKKLPKDKGEFFENDSLRIDVKYSDEAKEKELIKFTSKDGEPIIFSVGEMLDLIREQFRERNLAASLTTADTTFIPSVEAAVPISFNANKDIAKGELVQFYAPMNIPLGIALVMEANRLCTIKGKEIMKIPTEEFEEAKVTLKEGAKEFVEKFFNPQIDALKKKRAELGQVD